MRHQENAIGLVTTLLLVALSVAACTPTATAIVPPAVGSATYASATSVPANVAPAAPGKIAVLLPEAKTARYESQDMPDFKARLQELGFDVADNLIYSNANQDAAAQQAQAEAALTNGAKVLVLDPVDSAAAAAIADMAAAAGVPVISYDRLITGTKAVRYYISFDGEQVGRLQAQSLLTALKTKANPTIVVINGSPTDHNAILYKQGAHTVLDDHVIIAQEYDTPAWSPDQAQNEMTQALTALSNHVDGVLAANDGTAGGAIAAMKAAGLSLLPPVTGQDAELAAIQRILVGEQYMTVYKAIKAEADVAAVLAYDVLMDLPVPANTINSTVDNGAIGVPSVLLVPVAVTKANVETTIIADGFWKASDICTEAFVQACAEAGVR